MGLKLRAGFSTTSRLISLASSSYRSPVSAELALAVSHCAAVWYRVHWECCMLWIACILAGRCSCAGDTYIPAISACAGRESKLGSCIVMQQIVVTHSHEALIVVCTIQALTKEKAAASTSCHRCKHCCTRLCAVMTQYSWTKTEMTTDAQHEAQHKLFMKQRNFCKPTFS